MNNPQTQHIFMMDHVKRESAYRPGEDFAAWQKAAREKLGALLGMDTFEKCEDNLQIEWTKDEADYTEYRLLFNTEAHYQARAHLRVPKGAQGAVPVVICLQGHATGMHISLGVPKFPGDAETISGGDRDFARQVIAKGYAALALEQRGFGECGGTEKGPACYQPAMAALLLGRTILGERVWDISRMIDLLEKHFPQVDVKRLAVMGNSGGGTATIYAAAMDERIAAAMPSCAFCGYKESIGVQYHCSCNYVPGVMRSFDMGDLTGLIAPRPLVIVNGLNDTIFPIDSANREYETTKKLYAASGAPDMCRHIVGPEGHRFYAALGWPAFDALTGWKR